MFSKLYGSREMRLSSRIIDTGSQANVTTPLPTFEKMKLKQTRLERHQIEQVTLAIIYWSLENAI